LRSNRPNQITVEQTRNYLKVKPLYTARIEDLGPGDCVKVECTVCGHTELLPSVGLLQGMRLPPYTHVLDLKPKLRCRECDTKGRVVVSISGHKSAPELGAVEGPMTFEIIMAIIGVAIAVGQVVAVKGAERKTTLYVALPLCAVLVTLAIVGRNLYDAREREQKLNAAKKDILAHFDGMKTFQDIYAATNYRDFEVVNDVIDSFLGDGTMDFKDERFDGSDGRSHAVRFFFIKKKS
jgi:hypothetical protein